MQIKYLNHNNENGRDFDLTPSRLAYLRAGREAPEGHTVEKTEADKKIKDMKEKQDGIEKKKTAITDAISKYNQEYAKRRRFIKPKSYQEAIKINESNNFSETISQIDKILTTPIFVDGKWRAIKLTEGQGEALRGIRNLITNATELFGDSELNYDYIQTNWNELAGMRNEHKINQGHIKIKNDNKKKLLALESISSRMQEAILALPENDPKEKAMVEAWARVLLQIQLLEGKVNNSYKQLNEGLNEITEELTLAHGNNLTERMNVAREMTEVKSGWEKRPAYQTLKRAFDSAKNDSEFRELFGVIDGGIPTNKQRESEQLFFAIVARETNDFRSDFILGEEFGEDHDENKKRFPYIYNEWLKAKGFDPMQLEKFDSNVSAIKSTMKAKNINENVADFFTQIQEEHSDLGISAEVKNIESFNALPPSEKWLKTENELNKIWHKLQKGARGADFTSDRDGIKKMADQVDLHKKLAKAEYERSMVLKRHEGAHIEFTRSNLGRTENRQLLMEISMRKYMKAMQMVDAPFEKDDWRTNYHPMVRRLLIASVYDAGVSEYRLDASGEPQYNENLNPDYYWMLAELSKSPYFNSKEHGKDLTERHRSLLLVARLANKVSINLADLPRKEQLLTEIIEFKGGESADDESGKRNFVEGLSKKGYSQDLIHRYMEHSLDNLRGILTTIDNQKKSYEKFLESARDAIRNPHSEKTDAFIKEIKEGKYAGEGLDSIISKEDFERTKGHLSDIEFNNRTLELQEQSRMQYFEHLGIRLEGLYSAYLAEIMKDPEMNVDNWDDYLTSPDETKFNKLYELLDKIIPNSNKKGKEDFLAVFKTLHGERGALDPEHRDDQASAIAIYTMLKIQIKHAERVKAAEDLGETAMLAKLNGMTIGDKITDYAKNIWGMAFGPGQSLVNRGAGLVILFAFLKMARGAWKGDDRWGKALRALAVAGAGELAVKHVTGRGIIERFGLETMAQAIEGTRKAVLVERGNEYMESKEITKEQHAASLYELDKVPFKDVMEWYKQANKESGAFDAGQPNSIWTNLKINTGAIIKERAHWDPVNRDLEARRVVMHTVRNFFEYVGSKDDKGETAGAKMLEERWGRILDPDFKPDYTEFDMSTSFIEEIRNNPNKLTWRMIMENEIDLHHVDETIGQNGLQPYIDTAGRMGEAIMRWGRRDVYGPLSARIEDFARSAGIQAEAFKDFLSEVGEKAGSQLHFTKESISFSWENNKYKIRRVLGQHAELVLEAVKLPFAVIYKVDQAVVPWSLTKLRQLKAIGSRHDITTIQRNIEADDILADPSVLTGPDIIDAKKNPGFATFGYFQDAFHRAFQAGGINNDGKFDREPYFEDDTNKVGYYISEIDMETAGIDTNDASLSESNILNIMEKKAYDNAEQFFRGKDQSLSIEDIKKLMYPIHVIKKSGDKQDRKLYVFWRMPLTEGAEFQLKNTGRWGDYENPNFHKHRPPFIVDPTKSFFENLNEAFIQSVDPSIKTFVGGATKIASLVPRILLGTAQTAGSIVHGIANIDKSRAEMARGGDRLQWASREALTPHRMEQEMDEFFTSATSQSLAISDFYKNKKNQDIYKLLLDFARTRNQVLYLGIFEGQRGYESTAYKNRPSDFSYDDLRIFYDKWRGESGNQRIPDFDRLIRGKITQEAREARTTR